MALRIFLWCMVLGSAARAQIVNIETLRIRSDSAGFSGRENFNFMITRNTSRLFTLNNNLALQYKENVHTALFLSDFSYTFGDNTDFENNGFFHLRYNYKKRDWLFYEAFSQYQTDILLRIKYRVLAGAGPRFVWLKKEKSFFVNGIAAMLEFDGELNNDITHQHVRMSSYISYSRQTENFLATALFYYQPRVDYWKDFRFSGQFQLNFRIWKNLSFTSTASVNYDAFPVVDPEIPGLTYKLTNGISYSF